jgi:hypothetical protein
MSGDESDPSFEELLRSAASELGRSLERAIDGLDVEVAARSVGLDPEAARAWVEDASAWVRAQLEGLGEELGSSAAAVQRALAPGERLTAGIPDPLDIPNDEQGAALAALASGRWAIEPGTDRLVATGDGPAPGDGLGTALELRVRDWITVDGQLTVAGHHALKRWLDTAQR